MTTWNTQNRPETDQRFDWSTSAEPTATTPAMEKITINPTRAHESYWKQRLQKRTYAGSDGKPIAIPDWHVRLSVGGKQTWFNTKKSNKEAAATVAKNIYVFLCTDGAKATLAKYRDGNKAQAGGKVCTVGEFLDEVQASSDLKAGTFEIYCKKFRSLVAGVAGIDGGKTKYDYKKGGHVAWIEEVRAVSLAKLTPDAVNKWKVAEVKKAAGNPIKLRRANITLRSVMLSSKSLFTAKIRKNLTVRLPSPLPLDGVALPGRERSRYRSEINVTTLMLCAKRELADGEVTTQATLSKRKNSAHWWLTDRQGKQRSTGFRWSDAKETAQAEKLLAKENTKSVTKKPQPELYKIFLLAFGCGLRRGEIDVLEWSRMLWHENKIRVETTEHGAVKTDDSEGDVSVDPATMAELKQYLPKPGAGTPFVIQSDVAPRPGAVRYKHYRCNRLFKELIRWLKSKGVSARNAVHTLRKECGSQVYATHGIVEAQKIMRHADLSVTREHYISSNAKTATFNPLALLAQAELKAAK